MLISVKDPNLNVVLTGPAARCLLLLLEASPDIVLQQEFFKRVWEVEGMRVPTNTLYQNISIVRRGLRAVGESDETFIVTIPRKGFQIYEGVRTSLRAEENAADTCTDHCPEAATAAPQSDTPKQVTTKASFGLLRKTMIFNGGKFLAYPGRLRTLLIVALLIIGLSLVKAMPYLHDEPSFFSHYTLHEQESGCNFFSKNDDPDSSGNYQIFKARIKDSGLNCHKYPWVYFPSSKTNPTLSAIVCRQEYTTASPSGCISLYIMGNNSE